MKIGDILQLEPTLDGTSGLGSTGPIPCRVVYIHPLKRFYVVEFRSRVTGETWRESVWFPLRPLQTDFYRLPVIGGRRG